jgi:splicing factor 3A subunit 3
MSGLLERIRVTHEVAEASELAVGKQLDENTSGQRAKVYQQAAVHAHVQKVVSTSEELKVLYDDKDELLKEEILQLRRGGGLDSFYEALTKTEEYHKRYPDLEVEDLSPSTLAANQREKISVEFSGEEVFGKYLDLNAQHALYCNLRFCGEKEREYVEYLDCFLDFGAVDEKIKEKEKKTYGPYLRSLHDYFVGFIRRVQPLVSTHKLLSDFDANFESAWTGGRGVDSTGKALPGGWTVAASSADANKNSTDTAGGFDLEAAASLADVEALGGDALKAALEGRGLKCGGTASDRAKRLWSVKGLDPSEIPAKLKAKQQQQQQQQQQQSVSSAAGDDVAAVAVVHGGSCSSGRKALARLEYLITQLSVLIMDIVRNTRKHAEKQQTRSADEKRREYEEEESGMPSIRGTGSGGDDDDDDDDDDDGPVHNPLKLPLGWDGKPIPLWMYRLHGLNEEFKCEICGNEVYKGRRNYDRHFTEAKHAGNLRLLGLPNTRHFHDVTSIADAQALYAKLQAEMARSQQRESEEFEDTQGNVLDRVTFENRARMGQL